jgi:hypothetical protein
MLRVLGSRQRRLVGMAMTVTVAALCAASSAAAQEAPRWEINAIPTPTHIQANTPRNETQKLTVDATAGTFTLKVPIVGTEAATTAAIPYEATATEVQAAIVASVGSGSASVTGGPTTATPHEYEVTFEGEQGAIERPLIEVDDSLLEGTASVGEGTKGVKPAQLVIEATNVGGEATDGSTITIGDALPAWLTATKVTGLDSYGSSLSTFNYGGGAPMSCEAAPAISCTYSGRVDPGDQLVVFVEMTAGSAPPAGAVDRATVEGGGGREAAVEMPLAPDATPVSFGPAPGSVFASLSNAQAGGHPDTTTSFWVTSGETDNPADNAKDISFDLPPGLVGSTVGMPRCSMTRVIAGTRSGGQTCPDDTMVGTAEVLLGNAPSEHPEGFVIVVPVYNIAPSPGEPAAFAFDAVILPVRLDTSVLSDGNYGVRVTAPDIAASAPLLGNTITIWGVPAEHSGPGSNGESIFPAPYTLGGQDPGQSRVPLLTSPQQCNEPLVATMRSDGWAKPGAFTSQDAPMGTPTGCGLVPFSSSFSLLPDTLEAAAPAGYAFDLNIPQQNTAGTLATSSLKDFKLELPEGVVVNPSAAWGLNACSDAQFYGPSHPSQEPASVANCPREAQVGEVEVETPDLEHPLKGQVFLGTPECDPCTPADAESGKMVRLLVQLVGEGEAGVVVKLEGHGLVDQRTGRITAVFNGTPQVPFNRLHFVLEGGPRAVLANPRVCGPVKASGDLKPWSSGLAPGEQALVGDSLPFYEFEITGGCFGPQFHPTFKTGMPNVAAGAHGEFTLAFGRGDEDQFLKQITLKTPPGLLGTLAGVELCKEAQAIAGTCGANSLLGTTEVLTGPGANPFLVEGGKAYLTEGYGGSSYGLSIVVPAVAGPYRLGGLNGLGEAADSGAVVVRSQIFVDPHTAQLTVVSGIFPSMLDGIPLQLKVVNVRINRPGFMFNPTSCEKLAITGTIASQEGISTGVSSPFQVTNCQALKFTPKFAVSTSGKTSKADGASLSVKLTYPNTPQGSEANVKSVKVDLPKQLPSRLTTLQKACTAAQFEANPAGCPAASVVGHAKAITPIVPVPLEGPAYFVSHGGEAFPSLIIVLQGYGVTVDLVGTTFISHAGITSSTFKQVPDVPIGSFELTLPEGKFSALAANGDLCASKLAMPTAFVGQNGATINESTPVSVTGCKPAITVTSHKVKGDTATIAVTVPAAGKLAATAKGLSKGSGKSSKAGTVRVKLTLTKGEVARLAKHPGRKLKARVKLQFNPTKGASLTTTTTVLIG